jgi:2-polyprenyl-6-methoxyphenol hydroxylase-like FAD-dependent oxidoreductase
VHGIILFSLLATSSLLSDIRVAVIEPTRPKPLDIVMKNDKTDLRVYAMTPASVRMFQSLGIWNKVCGRAQAYHGMQVHKLTLDSIVNLQLHYVLFEMRSDLGWIIVRISAL